MSNRCKHSSAIAGAKAGSARQPPTGARKTPGFPVRKRRRANGGGRSARRRVGKRSLCAAESAPGLRPIGIFDELLRRHPGVLPGMRAPWSDASVLAGGERRGSRGDFPPGASAGAAWDCPTSPRSPIFAVTIAGELFDQRLYHFRLPFSGSNTPTWCSEAKVLSRWRKGLQTPCGRWAACRNNICSDSLSAAFRNLDADASEDLTTRYEAFCVHYGMVPTRNNPGVSHENGSIESSHGHLKAALPTRCCCARRATSTISRRGGASSTRLRSAATLATLKAFDRSGWR